MSLLKGRKSSALHSEKILVEIIGIVHRLPSTSVLIKQDLY